MTVRLIANPRVRGSEYPAEHLHVLDPAFARAALGAIGRWPGYAPTPLVSLAGLARTVGVAAPRYEDGSIVGRSAAAMRAAM